MVQDLQDPYVVSNSTLDLKSHLVEFLADGKPENTFAFSGEAKNKKYATEIIHECHEAWRRLITGESPPGELSITNITVENSVGLISPNDPAYVNLPRATRDAPKPIEPASTCFIVPSHVPLHSHSSLVSKWFFISSAQV